MGEREDGSQLKLGGQQGIQMGEKKHCKSLLLGYIKCEDKA